MLIASESIFAEIWRRQGVRWITEIVRGADRTLLLNCIGLKVQMAELYEGIEMAQPRPSAFAAGRTPS
ncbi:MAG TPA: hypothetical protein VGR45_11755 [Stellaceae bacterium]|nr:hypothetical protein [Stellaceae bacterium]